MTWEHRDEPLSTAETALKGLIAIGYPLTTLLVGEQQGESRSRISKGESLRENPGGASLLTKPNDHY